MRKFIKGSYHKQIREGRKRVKTRMQSNLSTYTGDIQKARVIRQAMGPNTIISPKQVTRTTRENPNNRKSENQAESYTEYQAGITLGKAG